MMKGYKGRFLTLLLAFTLVIAYAVPVSALQETQDTAQDGWYDSIPEMLAVGEYEEGVVVAGIDVSKETKSGDPASALENRKLRSGAEELIYVDTEDALEDEEFTSWIMDLKADLAGQNDDGVCITSIRRDDMTTEQLLKKLASDDSVVFAEPNYIINTETDEIDASSADDEASANDTAGDNLTSYKVKKIDNIDYSRFQWSSSEDSSVHAANIEEAVSAKVPGWPDGSNMDHKIIVAVVDMPVDFSHPDLAGRAYTFSPELQDELGCDEHGYNAMYKSTDGKLAYDEDTDHGTHVAGILGAAWDGAGISGVASNVEIISVQSIDGSGYSHLVDALRAYSFIKKAVEKGVDIRVANNSWGLKLTSRALDAAVTEVGKLGVLSCFAASNDGKDHNAYLNLISTLADNPYAILVASTTPAGELADSSSFGRGIVDLAAPGAGILSCMQSSSTQYIPALSGTNKIYENFESSEPGTVYSGIIRICQVGYKEVTTVLDNGEDYSKNVPDPDNELAGTEGVIVTGKSDMGFEGNNVLKMTLNTKNLMYGDEGIAAIKIDFGDVSSLGISAGDYLGLAYGGISEVWMVDTASGSEPWNYMGRKSNRNCWNTHVYKLQEGIDNTDLSIIFEIGPEEGNEFYLDAIGIGNEKVPYAFMGGTSMATPAVTGAAAVLTSRHYSELESLDEAVRAERLANIVRSSVRPLKALSKTTSTGGIIDLSIDTSGSDPEDGPVMDIREISVSGRTVIVKGEGFGDTEGSAAAKKYIAGKHKKVTVTPAYWSDSLAVLSLSDDVKGIIEISLTSSAGKRDTIVKYLGKSSNTFEKDHHFGGGTGDPLTFDEPLAQEDAENLGDYDTAGVLVAGGSKLYYMPEMSKVEVNPAYKNLYCYDPAADSWSVCPTYPYWIKNASGAWLNGKLYIKGTAVDTDENGTIPHYSVDPIDVDELTPDYSDGEVCVYSYTPGASKWVKCSAANVKDEHTLFTAGNKLMLAGVTVYEFWQDSVKYPGPRNYDPAKGAGDPLSYTYISVANPVVAYASGYVFIGSFDYVNSIYVLNSKMQQIEDLSIDFPEFWIGDETDDGDSNVIERFEYSMTAYEDMLILNGPAAKDGSTDTYTLRAGQKYFRKYSKRVSDAQLNMPASAVLNGRLYVISGSNFEPGKRVFRSTALTKPVGAVTGTTAKASNGMKVRVTSNKTNTVSFVRPKNAKSKSVTIPATVTVNKKVYKVTGVDAKAFRNTKTKTVTIGKNVKTLRSGAFSGSKVTKIRVKSKLLTKKSVKGSLKGSKVKKVLVRLGKKSVNKKYVKKFKKYFTKSNAGRKVTVK